MHVPSLSNLSSLINIHDKSIQDAQEKLVQMGDAYGVWMADQWSRLYEQSRPHETCFAFVLKGHFTIDRLVCLIENVLAQKDNKTVVLSSKTIEQFQHISKTNTKAQITQFIKVDKNTFVRVNNIGSSTLQTPCQNDILKKYPFFLSIESETSPSLLLSPRDHLDNRCWDLPIQWIYNPYSRSVSCVINHLFFDGNRAVKYIEEILPSMDCDYIDQINDNSGRYLINTNQISIETAERPIVMRDTSALVQVSIPCKTSLIDSIIQLAIQRAYYYTYKKLGNVYESVDTSTIFPGTRTETCRSLTAASISFATHPYIDANLYSQAIQSHITTLHTIFSGNGCDRHLFSLKCLIDDPVHEINQTEHKWPISSSRVDSDAIEVFVARPIDHLGFSYTVDSNKITMAIIGPENEKQMLENIADDFRKIILELIAIELPNTISEVLPVNILLHELKKMIPTFDHINDCDLTWTELGLTSQHIIQLTGKMKEHISTIGFTYFFTNTTFRKCTSENIDKISANSPQMMSNTIDRNIFISGIGVFTPGYNGRDCTTVSELWHTMCNPDVSQTLYRIHDRDAFDFKFFNISEREASCMHRAQRWALRVAACALYDAGLLTEHGKMIRGKEKVGVFVGCWNRLIVDAAGSSYDIAGQSLSIIANRISYVFNLTGPSMVIDTACSSSLVAMYVAKNAIDKGDCEYALVIGVNHIDDDITEMLQHGNFLSKTGHCHTFDESADGYARSEGALAFLLSTDNHKYGKIVDIGTNQDGATINLHAPNPHAQEELLKKIVGNDIITLVETHGTGTVLGDPIEIESIRKVIPYKCRISSAKSQFGHMESAAGMIGAFRSLMCASQQYYPTNVYLKNRNPKINFGNLYY